MAGKFFCEVNLPYTYNVGCPLDSRRSPKDQKWSKIAVGALFSGASKMVKIGRNIVKNWSGGLWGWSEIGQQMFKK